MELSLATSIWRDRPLAEALDAARATGLNSLELDASAGSPHLNVTGGPEAWSYARTQVEGWRVGALYAPHPALPCSENEGGLEAVEHTVAAMKAAKVLGARVVVTSLGDTGIDAWDQAWSRSIGALRVIVKQGQRTGVRLAVELSRQDVLDSLKKVRRLLEEIPDTRLGIALDTGLTYVMRVDWPEALLATGPRLYHVRLRDATRRSTLQTLGTGEVRFASIFRQLRAYGYVGSMALAQDPPQDGKGPSVDEALAAGWPHLEQALAEGLPQRKGNPQADASLELDAEPA